MQASSIIGIAIAKSCQDKKEQGGCEPVLVADVTSTGNRYQPLLLRAATSTGQTSDQYWLLSLPCMGIRYVVVLQYVVVCSLGAPFPCREKEISPRGGRRILGEILKAHVRSEPIRGLPVIGG